MKNLFLGVSLSLLGLTVSLGCTKESISAPEDLTTYPFATSDFGFSILGDNLINQNAIIEYRVINYSDSAYSVDQNANGGFFRIRFSIVTKDNEDYGSFETIPFIASKDTIEGTTSIPVEGKEYLDLNGRVEFVEN